MKNNNKLFEKKFDLSLSNIFGGMAQETNSETSSMTEYGDHCTDTEWVTNDDNGNFISSCTEYECDFK